MNVKITEKGTMIISAEGETENYALVQWATNSIRDIEEYDNLELMIGTLVLETDKGKDYIIDDVIEEGESSTLVIPETQV